MFSVTKSKMHSLNKQSQESLEKVTNLTKQLAVNDSNTVSSGESRLVPRFSNFEPFDDYEYKLGEPFEKLSKLMFSMHQDKIKKRVLRKGSGPIISGDSSVTIEYEAYTELRDKPFDTSVNGMPHTISLTGDQELPGLSLAIQSMQAGEISQFLLSAQFAYGYVGWVKSISPEALLLYVVEIKKVINPNKNKNKLFCDVVISARAFCTKGNQLYLKGLIKPAVTEYSKAISHLRTCKITNKTDLEEKHQMLLRTYTNLVIAHTKIHETRQACNYSRMIYNMCNETGLKVPVKVYVNHARCLSQMSDLNEAERLLRKAKALDPHNEELDKEMIKLQIIKKTKPTFKYVPVESIRLKSVEISQQFKEAMTQYCIDLLDDKNETQYEFPIELSKTEQEYALAEMQRFGLYFKQSEINGATRSFISKDATSQ